MRSLGTTLIKPLVLSSKLLLKVNWLLSLRTFVCETCFGSFVEIIISHTFMYVNLYFVNLLLYFKLSEFSEQQSNFSRRISHAFFALFVVRQIVEVLFWQKLQQYIYTYYCSFHYFSSCIIFSNCSFKAGNSNFTVLYTSSILSVWYLCAVISCIPAIVFHGIYGYFFFNICYNQVKYSSPHTISFNGFSIKARPS